jgi:hypothetical protein
MYGVPNLFEVWDAPDCLHASRQQMSVRANGANGANRSLTDCRMRQNLLSWDGYGSTRLAALDLLHLEARVFL